LGGLAAKRKEKVFAAFDDVRKRNGDPPCSMRGNRGEETLVETNTEERDRPATPALRYKRFIFEALIPKNRRIPRVAGLIDLGYGLPLRLCLDVSGL
jgi:hypothetical protein